jgi:hypothetical protein
MCMNCAIQIKKHTYTNEVEDCCVCLENKIMLILKCNHKVCNNCWYNITNEGFIKTMNITHYVNYAVIWMIGVNNWCFKWEKV